MAQWFELHADAVEAVARGLTRDAHLAADVCQTVFSKAIRKFATVPDGAERAWLLRVAKNEAIDVLRKRGRERKAVRATPLPGPLEGPSDDGPRAAMQRERAEGVQRALADLSEQDRDLLMRRFEQGQTFAVIAEETDRPLGTVLSRAHRLLKNLESRLRGVDDD